MKKNKVFIILVITLIIVFVLSMIALIEGDYLAATFDVIGIRIAVLIVAFASFGASTLFSLLVYSHNKTVTKINDDTNKRGELFREMQYAASNYSMIEFNDRMLITKESSRYIHKFYDKGTPSFHMIQDTLDLTKEIDFLTIRIPFSNIEGKHPANINLSKIRFERDNEIFTFIPMQHENFAQCYILYNEKTKRNNLIMNLVFNKDTNYFNESKLNLFTKIKIWLQVTSILSVTIDGMSELYFTNPTQVEGDGLHTYKINSSNLRVLKNPYIENK